MPYNKISRMFLIHKFIFAYNLIDFIMKYLNRKLIAYKIEFDAQLTVYTI